jgi:DNA polymerase-3 subunit alpha
MHLHTYYSFLDGHGSPEKRVKKAKELGMTAIAITDHNHVGGVIDFQNACKKENIKPILGCEMYFTEDTGILSKTSEERYNLALEKARTNGVVISDRMLKKDIKTIIEPYAYDTKQYHIIFLAKNQTGWSNLVKLQSEAARVCTYNGRFLCDDNMINKYKDGLIMTTACIGNIVNNYILEGDVTKAYEQLDKWRELFHADFYIELQPLNSTKQAICNWFLINYAINNNVKIIATNDVHYTNKEDIDDHDTLLCVGIVKSKDDENRMRYAPEFWMRSYDEMIEAFTNQYTDNEFLNTRFNSYKEYIDIIIEALENTNYLADQIEDNIKLGSDTTILPKLNIPNGFTSEQYLTLKSYKGLFEYLAKNKELDIDEYLNRLAFELNVINTKGYADYMLIVEEYVSWCKDNDIPVGPGRGSAAGSLVLFSIGVTKCIDPIKYGLLFSRFLTMDRTALPDVDVDFSYLNRQKVIQHLKDLYGEECVSAIGTYTVMGVKSGLKDVGRALRIDFATMNAISKKIDEWSDYAPSIKFKDLDNLAEGNDNDKAKYKEFKECENKNAELFRLARVFEGTPRNAGVHASGILVTPMPVNDIFPTRIDKTGKQVTLYTGPQCEELGSCKLDILGLATLDVLDLTVKAIDPKSNVYELYDEVNNHLDDEEMFKGLNRKETEGIFQFESSLFKGLISDIQPESIEDATLMTALGRPGPLKAGLNKSFGRRKMGTEEACEPLPNTWDIVEDSLGVLAYQEHTMRIAQRVAGFDDNQADSYLRKAQAKKKRYLLDLCNQWFIYGKINEEPPEGYDENNKNQPYYDPDAHYGAPIKGGIANGYDEQALIYYTIMIEDFCSYLFNKSHAATYSFITLCTMYLDTYCKTEFLAALLSLQSEQEKINLYCKVAKNNGIEVSVPEINYSNEKFVAINETILFGLNSIKGVGETAVPTIIANRPYVSIADAYKRIGKKAFNKRIGEALIKAGAFDFLNSNRNTLLNEFQDIRKAKKEDRFDEINFNQNTVMEYEKEVLGSSITYTPFWDSVKAGETVSVEIELTNTREKVDKNGNMMAFLEVTIENMPVKGVVFASVFCKNRDAFDMDINKKVNVSVKKDDKGGFIVNKILKELPKKTPVKNKEITGDILDRFDKMMNKIS